MSKQKSEAIEILKEWKESLDDLREQGIDPSHGDGYWKIDWADLNAVVESFLEESK